MALDWRFFRKATHHFEGNLSWLYIIDDETECAIICTMQTIAHSCQREFMAPHLRWQSQHHTTASVIMQPVILTTTTSSERSVRVASLIEEMDEATCPALVYDNNKHMQKFFQQDRSDSSMANPLSMKKWHVKLARSLARNSTACL
jgi:hypothetical protein